MVDPMMTQIGVVGCFALLVIDRVLKLVKPNGLDSRQTCQQIKDLHKWHDRDDEEGVKVWYVRRSLELAVEKLASNIDIQTRVMQDLLRQGQDLHAAIGQVGTKVERLASAEK